MGLLRGDPSRIAAQVLSGIGFLGAGTIIQMKGSVRGLTTAAGIWIIATIGMAVGCGLYLIAVVATLLVLIVLTLLEQLEHRVNVGNEARTIRLKVNGIVKSIAPYREVLGRFGIHLSKVYVEYDYDTQVTRLNLLILIREHSDFIDVFDAFARCVSHHNHLAIQPGRPLIARTDCGVGYCCVGTTIKKISETYA